VHRRAAGDEQVRQHVDHVGRAQLASNADRQAPSTASPKPTKWTLSVRTKAPNRETGNESPVHTRRWAARSCLERSRRSYSFGWSTLRNHHRRRPAIGLPRAAPHIAGCAFRGRTGSHASHPTRSNKPWKLPSRRTPMRSPVGPKPNRARSVFINCPFDPEYRPLLRASCFAVMACGYAPRCALDYSDSGLVRFTEIVNMIAACDRSIHDISRVELEALRRARRH